MSCLHIEANHQFRVGIELETGALLPEFVMSQHKFQKTPLFYCQNSRGMKYWHVEIDTIDIEFVTVPFSGLDEAEFSESVSSLQNAACILREIVNSKKEATLGGWLQILKDKNQHLNWYTCDLFEPLKDAYIQWNGRRCRDWDGLLQPHITVQMPLQMIIEFIFGLFSEDSCITSILEGALPFYTREDCDKYFSSDNKRSEREKFQNKLDGLMFLQALTMLDLTLPVFDRSENKLAERLVNDDVYCHEILDISDTLIYVIGENDQNMISCLYICIVL